MRQLDASHPMFAGHFPGNPLVPGAYLLALAIEDARARLRELGSDHEPVGVRTIKFLAPLRPGQPFRCEFDPIDERAWRFTIEGAVGRVAMGTLLLEARAPADGAASQLASKDHGSQR